MDYINKLLNQNLLNIGRASNLLWITFGDVIRKNTNGREVETGEYSLHFQCPWRIIDEESSMIKLASGDIYEPNSEIEWSDNFDWEPQGNNLFDEKLKLIFPFGEEIRVKKIFILPNNDLKIFFSNKLIFESYIDVSTEQECWRFIKQGEKKHFVVGGNFKEFQ